MTDIETLDIERGEHQHYGYGMDPVICAECGVAIDPEPELQETAEQVIE